jgi:hypothetical protein
MTALRTSIAVALLLSLIPIIACGSIPCLVSVTAVAFLLHALQVRNLRKCIHQALPILVFCLLVYILGAVAHHASLSLAVRTLASYTVLRLASGVLPTAALSRLVQPNSLFFVPALFLLFTVHFLQIVKSESMRSLLAYRMAAPRLYRSGGLRALVYCLDSLLRQCITRAERFYAAQSLRGLAQ